MFLSKFVFDNTDDIKVRKLLVNAFIREVILYDDEIVITYNFTDSPEHLKLTKEHIVKTEKEIETADKTAISSNIGSYKLCHTAPMKKQPYENREVVFSYSHTDRVLAHWMVCEYEKIERIALVRLLLSARRRNCVPSA